MRTLLVAALVLSSSLALADITPEQAATVDREKQKALDDVAKKYGNKKPSEMTNDERRAKMADETEAVNKVLDKNGVSAKEYSKFEATASSADRQAAKASGAAQEKKEADDKAAADKAAKAAAEAKKAPAIVIEKDTDKKRGGPPSGNPAEMQKQLDEQRARSKK
jgi:hypothetical protein